MARFDTVITGGTVIDGTRAIRRHADVGIRHGVIEVIADAIGTSEADLVLDARGLIVAPGYTDAGFTFTFEDWNLFDESDAWAEATTGTVDERLAKLADPARRQGLRDGRIFAAVSGISAIVVLDNDVETGVRSGRLLRHADRAGAIPLDKTFDE